MIITLDGPAGSGKSTVAKRLAAALGYAHLDTGAMYRAVALAGLERGLDLADAAAAAELAKGLRIELDPQPEDQARVLLDGRDVSAAVRSLEVSRSVAVVAQHPGVREALVAQQRRWAQGRNVVAEGRDMGTVVFPEARLKVYLQASARERARRRQAQLAGQGVTVALDELETQQRERDRQDQERAASPLRPATDARVLDSTDLAVDEVVARLREWALALRP